MEGFVSASFAGITITIPFYLGQIFVTVFIRIESSIEIYGVHSLELVSCYHFAKIAFFI